MSEIHQTPQKAQESVGERNGLALPIELEEGAPPVFARASLAVVSGLIIMLLVWANIAHVRELSVAAGEIAPDGSTRQAAHLEGGIVENVLVSPGDIVDEGDPLVQLRVENAGGEYDRFNARRANLTLRAERLAAQAAGRTPEFASLAASWPSLVEEQSAIYDASTEQHRATMANLHAREASAASEVAKTEAELKAETELLAYAQEQLAIQDDLIEDGFTSKQAHLEAKAAVSSAKAKAAAARSRLDQAERAHAGAQAELKSAEAEFANRIAEERSKVVAELAELKEPISSMKDRNERLTVRAPIGGVVNDVAVNGRGDVVAPGGLIAEITPVGAKLIAEVRVDPKDIGHVATGLKTEVTVTTFDPNRYGKISGYISHISADTFTDERTGEAYYIAYVALDRQDVGSGVKVRKLAPGMQVRAEIITQRRTLMQYALKPVVRSLDSAFTER